MQYRKKPVVIQAVPHTGGNHPACSFMDDNGGNGAYYWRECELYIKTLEGDHHVSEGDFVIKGVNGEFYPCKRDIFEKTYEAVEIEPCDCDEAPQSACLDFGLALRFLKAGLKVARAGWNGKGMWLAYSPGSKKLPANKFWAGPNRDYANAMSEQCADVLPYITMKTATGEILMGWLASQTDMLANDWQVVE